MAFKIKRVGHLVLRVKDMQRSRQFFEDVLHFPVVAQNERGMVCYTVYHGISKSIYFNDPDGNTLDVYCNVPEEEYRKSVPNPYSRYGSIEEELEGKTPQRAGTVAP